LRAVQNLPFCYLCGKAFVAGDPKNRDHVPPECVFLESDREPLLLRTHPTCNQSYQLIDERIGQLIALKYGKLPSKPEHDRLKFAGALEINLAAVTNVDV